MAGASPSGHGVAIAYAGQRLLRESLGVFNFPLELEQFSKQPFGFPGWTKHRLMAGRSAVADRTTSPRAPQVSEHGITELRQSPNPTKESNHERSTTGSLAHASRCSGAYRHVTKHGLQENGGGHLSATRSDLSARQRVARKRYRGWARFIVARPAIMIVSQIA